MQQKSQELIFVQKTSIGKRFFKGNLNVLLENLGLLNKSHPGVYQRITLSLFRAF